MTRLLMDIAAVYDVPREAITLSADTREGLAAGDYECTPGLGASSSGESRRRGRLLQQWRRRLLSLVFRFTIDPALTHSVETAALLDRMNQSVDALVSRLSANLTRADTPTLLVSFHNVTRNVTTQINGACSPGYWCTAGKEVSHVNVHCVTFTVYLKTFLLTHAHVTSEWILYFARQARRLPVQSARTTLDQMPTPRSLASAAKPTAPRHTSLQ